MVVMASANSLRQNSTSERGHGAATNGAKELAQGHVSEVSGQDLLWQGPACVRPRGMHMNHCYHAVGGLVLVHAQCCVVSPGPSTLTSVGWGAS